jgi:hypothetical protein
MHNRGNYFWGIVLVLLGGLLLAQNMGLIPPNVSVWSIFWALVLMALGVSLLLRNMRPEVVRGEPGAMSGPVSRRGEAVRIPLGSARRATLRFHYGAGELRVDGNAAPDELLSGTFVGGLDHQESLNDDALMVDLRVPSNNLPMVGPFGPGDALNWTLGLNPIIPLVLDMEVGASRNLVNLRDLQVKELRLQTGASATEIDMPARAGEVRASLKSGAASVVVRIPEGVSANIRTRGALSATHVDTQRFPQVGSGEYRSPDYDMAANRVDLDVESGVGEIRIS